MLEELRVEKFSIKCDKMFYLGINTVRPENSYVWVADCNFLPDIKRLGRLAPVGGLPHVWVANSNLCLKTNE